MVTTEEEGISSTNGPGNIHTNDPNWPPLVHWAIVHQYLSAERE